MLSCTNEDLQRHANVVMIAVIDSLVKEQLISQDEADDYLGGHAVMAMSNSWMNKFLSKKTHVQDGHVSYRIVEIAK